MSVPFVGRADELQALTALVRRAGLERAPGAALIVGEPGSGKSRLLGEVLGHADGQFRVSRVAGFEPMQSVPLAAVADLLRALTQVPGEGVVLERLVFRGAPTEDLDPLRIFEAAHRALASAGPAMIAVDDMQWMDERSIALVQYLLRAAASPHQAVVVVAAARPSPAAATFRSSFEAELPADRRTVIDLGPLPLDDARSLAHSIVPGLDAAEAADLWRRAGGSPFWVEALARGRRDGRDASGLIDDRLRDLSPDSGSLLAALAIGARPFTDDDMAALLGWEVDRVRQATRELVARGLAIGAGGTNRVAHDLLREAAAGTLPIATRRGLHGRIAAWIESAAGDDLPMLREALDHRAAAGLPRVDLAIRLLGSPRRRLLGGDDLRLLATISDDLEPRDPRRLELDRSLGELAAVLGEQELALHRWTTVGSRETDPRERQRAEFEAARAAYRLGRSDDAHAHIERAHRVRSAEGETAVELDALQAEVELWLDHETAAGSRSAARALEAAEALAAGAGGIDRLTPEARRAYLAALVVAGDAALQQDRAGDVILLSATVLHVAEGLDDASHVAALIRTGFALRPLGRVRESEAQYREARDISRRLVLPILTIEAGHGLARGLRDMGRLGEAREVAEETARLEARIRNAPRRWGSAASIVHTIQLSPGDPAAALRALHGDAASEPDPHYRLAIRQATATWQARTVGAAAVHDVESQLVLAEEDAALAGCPRCSAELKVVSAELLARVGRVDAARKALAAWDRRKSGVYLQRDLWRLRAAAAIAVADGDAGLAVTTLSQYAEGLERADLHDDLLWARIDLGRVLAGTDRTRAIAELTEAAGLAQRSGALSQGRLIAQALRRLGVRAWRRGRTGMGEGRDRLSAREREIARLVSEGASNREIAEALLVSPKTVERHVTNVFAKLGLRNRTELAALVRSEPVRDSPDD